ncbi:acyl-CoA dehydrogenase family protein [Lacisediminimonas profundi]|uniref:acyl-CoA dehydrogenase family protein n=1 Tax=Lacisediminimonas profundi TaxID=2603856 RepID=UPI00124B5885|nr:acyl-CoA dehydrogenase family protein [Lacisediminimonas profundi]
MDFAIDAADAELRDRVRAFVIEKIIPYESDPRLTEHGPTDALRVELNGLARAAGLLAPHVARHYGGLGLSHRQRAIVFEAAGYSALGPIALHCAAPDEGNMHMLEVVANEEQKERYLRPLATAQVRSCFAMTEPHPGAGSDPGQLATRADRDGDHFVINGEKWLITGADGAGFMIIMARAFDGEQDLGATMFFSPLPAAGIRIKRTMHSLDSSFTGGHAHVMLENLRVPADAVLGEIGQGLRYAQLRLAPARLTHCMRWLGAANRAHDIATAHACKRMAFGKPLIEHEGVGFQLADNELDMYVSRLTIQEVAWRLDQGQHARHESSMAKVIVSEALYRIGDRCVQVLGGIGLTDETQVERIFRELRAFRIYDGPSEVHRWAIANRLARQQGRKP